MKKKLFVMFLSFSLIFAFTGCGNSSETETPAPEQEVQQVEEPEKESSVPADPSKLAVIKGSQVIDIIESLDAQGIPSVEGVETEYGYQYNSSNSDYAYKISTDKDNKVKLAVFEVLTEDQGYLGYCASMPYDTADSDKATEWVRENIGSDLSITIGDALFQLSNSETGPVLTIQASVL